MFTTAGRRIGAALGAGALSGCLVSTETRAENGTMARVQDLEKRLSQLEMQLTSEQGAGCIVSIGEALIDFLPRPLQGETGYLPRCGGAPFNLAITTARLGAPTAFLSTISTDMFGEKICKQLSENGVSLDLVQRVPQPSTLAFVQIKNDEPEYAFFFENAADRALTVASTPQLPSNTSALHLSLGAITLEAAVADVFGTLIGDTKDYIFTSFDPNIRSMMISDPVTYRLQLEEFVNNFDLVKVSDADLDYLYGAKKDMPAIAKNWLSRGVKLVLITQGSEGTLAFRPDGSSFHMKLDPVKVVDAVGAGDSYMGALLVALQQRGGLAKGALEHLSDDELKQSMDFAAKVAAITCTRAGADPPTIKEVEETYRTSAL